MLHVALIERGLGKTKWNGPGKLKLEGQKKDEECQKKVLVMTINDDTKVRMSEEGTGDDDQ